MGIFMILLVGLKQNNANRLRMFFWIKCFNNFGRT